MERIRWVFFFSKFVKNFPKPFHCVFYCVLVEWVRKERRSARTNSVDTDTPENTQAVAGGLRERLAFPDRLES